MRSMNTKIKTRSIANYGPNEVTNYSNLLLVCVIAI